MVSLLWFFDKGGGSHPLFLIKTRANPASRCGLIASD
jgi:hypothetical protein